MVVFNQMAIVNETHGIPSTVIMDKFVLTQTLQVHVYARSYLCIKVLSLNVDCNFQLMALPAQSGSALAQVIVKTL